MPVQTVRTPYIHTGTYLYLFTLLPACDHERPSERHAGRGPFCACHAPKVRASAGSVRASAGSLSSPSFVRRDQRVRSHTHLAAALVRHDDHAIPVDTIGFPRSESPDLCEASPALAPYYVHDYSGSILPAIRFLYKCQATARTLLPPEAQTHATARVGRTDKSRCLVDSRRDSCQTTVPAISEQLLRSPA